MSKLKAAARWLLDHWYLPLFVLGAVFGAIVTADRKKPREKVEQELEVIRAGAEVRKVKAEQGKAAALAKITLERQRELKSLDEDQQAKAEKLRQDPVALSRFLVRAGQRR